MNTIFFLLFIFIGTEIPKFWENSGLLYDKRKLSKKLILGFFSDCYIPNPKVHAKPPIWENYTTLPETCTRINFNNIIENESFQRFTKKKAKTDANQPMWKNTISLPKIYILSVFKLVTYKKRDNGCKALVLGKKMTLRKRV